MLKVGDPFPQFNIKRVISANTDDAFIDVNSITYNDKWKIYFFWPKHFMESVKMWGVGRSASPRHLLLASSSYNAQVVLRCFCSFLEG